MIIVQKFKHFQVKIAINRKKVKLNQQDPKGSIINNRNQKKKKVSKAPTVNQRNLKAKQRLNHLTVTVVHKTYLRKASKNQEIIAN